MKNQKRGQRRYDERKIQKKRFLRFIYGSFSRWQGGKRTRQQFLSDPDWQKHLNKFKHTGCTCSCSLCKPWKHKCDSKYKPSERRRIS